MSNKLSKITDEKIKECIGKVSTIRELLVSLDVKPVGGNYKVVQDKIKKMGMTISDIFGSAKKRSSWSKGKILGENGRGFSLEKIMVEDFYYPSFSLKKRLLKTGVFKEECSNCKLTQWLEAKIPLELDHINGNNRDNRLNNLRLLCPNCHALTETYRGKNKRPRGETVDTTGLNPVAH